MRNVKFFAMAVLACVFTFASCQKEAPEDQLSISASQISASAVGEEQVITFVANNAWEMVSSSPWVSVTPDSGAAGEATVTVKIAANDTFEPRQATLTLQAGKKTASWIVKQGFVEVFNASSEIEVNADAHTIAVKVNTNQSFTAVSDVDWVSVVTTKAAPVDNSVVLSVMANPTIETRTATVTVTAADGNVNVYKVKQGPSQSAMSLDSVYDLGASMDPRNYSASCPNFFTEYALNFTSANGSVVICINTDGKSFAGEYEVDAAGNHAPGTFSIKPADKYNAYYTTIVEDGKEIVVIDGSVVITASGTDYTLSAELVDEHELVHSFSAAGTIPTVEVKNVGAASYINYKGTYNTFFGNKQVEYDVTLYPSASPAKDIPWVYNMGFSLLSANGGDNTKIVPGKYVFQEAKTAEGGYTTGTDLYEGSALAANGAYIIKDAADTSYYYADILGGYVEVSNGVEGTMTFDVHLTMKGYDYDANWDVVPVGDQFEYVYKFENVNVDILDSHIEPQPDEDAAFTFAFPQTLYAGMWFGDAYQNGGNVFIMGWSSGVNNVYTVQMVLQTASPWEFVQNFNGKYCSTPIPSGVYTYNATTPSNAEGAAVNTICNITASYKNSYCAVKNSYTGTVAPVTGGTITLTDTAIEFNLTCTSNRDGKEIHYTGGFDTTSQYFRNYSAASYAKYVKWATL